MGGAGLIAEEFMRLRHALIPYIYSAMLDTNEKGKALIEPMYYDYPEKGAAYEAKSQYMFGTELLVAPVTAPGDEKGLARTKVWLPEGRWTDIFTGDIYEGGRWADTVRFMESIPVFAKEGAIVPLDARKNTNSIAEPDKLRVMVFNGDGAYTLREDSGETRFSSKASDGKQTLTFTADEGTVGRRVTLEFRNVKDGEVTVYAGGKAIEADVRADDFVSVSFDAVPGTEYTVEVAYTYGAREYRNDRLVWALTRLSLPMSNKDRIWKWASLDDKELMRNIMTAEYLTENEKIRLTEGW
jgi:alpha-glucosidase (family GH31 glycosyl hydrolase)